MTNVESSPSRLSHLEKIAEVLEVISASSNGLSLSEISERTNFPLPSTHRLLSSLLAAEFVSSQPQGRSAYRIGPRILRLFQKQVTQNQTIEISEPFLRVVSNKYNEVTYLACLRGDEIIMLHTVRPTQTARSLVYPGEHFPLNATATAKILVAYQESSLIDKFLSSPLEKFRPNTQVEPVKLREQLERVRKDGYSVNDDEFDEGVCTVCCPVLVEGEKVIYAIGIVGFKERLLTSFRVEDIVIDLQRACMQLAISIAHRTSDAGI